MLKNDDGAGVGVGPVTGAVVGRGWKVGDGKSGSSMTIVGVGGNGVGVSVGVGVTSGVGVSVGTVLATAISRTKYS